MPASTPLRAGQQAPDGAAFVADVVAAKLAIARTLNNLEQTDVADRMRFLGHTTWTRATVSQVERGHRNVTVPELVALVLVLGLCIADLLDPRMPFGELSVRGQSRPGGLRLALEPGGHLEPLEPDAVGALACGHNTRMRVTWDGNELASVELREAGQ